MAIVKMKHLRLLAMQDDREDVLHLLQRMGCVEIDEPRLDEDPAWEQLSRPEGGGLSAAQERKSQAEQALAVLKKYAPEKGGLLRPRPMLTEKQLFGPQAQARGEQAVKTINDLQKDISALQAQMGRLSAQKAVLAPWLSLDLPLDTQSTREMGIHWGTVSAAHPLESVEQAVTQASELAELTQASADREYRYLLLVCHTSGENDVMEALKQFGWSRANLRDWKGTAAENDRRIDQELEKLEKALKADEEQLSQKGELRDAVCQAIDRASVEINREQSRQRLLDTQTAFCLEGWIPADAWDDIRKELGAWPCAWEVEDPTPEEYPNVPVQLRNNAVTRPMNMVTEMYSLPAYGSLDPNPLMAPFFILFYGMMMADMGYGLLMMIAGLFVVRKVKPKGTMDHMFRLVGLCGVTTFLFGAVTGGFFGDFIPKLVEILSPSLYYAPPALFAAVQNDGSLNFALPSLFTPVNDTLAILVGALALGVVQILTGMVISVYKKVRNGKFMDALWEEITWWVILGGLVLAILGVTNLVLILGGILLVVGCVVKAVQEGGGPVKIITGSLIGLGGSLYNNITGYFQDILSYARLMALMLSGAVVAQVFNTLGAIPGNIFFFIPISMIGNLLNFALNILGCYVHDMRLQCLEFFNRFYEDGGKPFKPLEISTKYVDIQQ